MFMFIYSFLILGIDRGVGGGFTRPHLIVRHLTSQRQSKGGSWEKQNKRGFEWEQSRVRYRVSEWMDGYRLNMEGGYGIWNMDIE